MEHPLNMQSPSAKHIVASCISLLLSLGSSQLSAENDINAQDLNRDLQQQSKNIQSASTIPGNEQAPSTEEILVEEELPPWFKVEVIVFKQTVGTTNEIFPETVDFTPPESLFTLNDYAYPEEHFLRSEKQGLTYLNKEPEETEPTEETSEPSTDTAAPDNTSPGTMEISTEPVAYHQEELLLLEDAYKRLEKNKNYEILLATSWQQPTIHKDEAPTLHLVAGNWFDNQPEFEAFLKISKQRYLHAYADLFLKTYNLKTEHAIELDLSSEVLSTDQATSDNSSTASSAAEVQTLETQGSDTPETDNQPLITKPIKSEPSKQDSFNLAGQGIQTHHFQLFTLDVNEDLLGQTQEKESSYITDEVYMIREDRIMKRSKDLYYLDHPKFGMIIKLTPQDKVLEFIEEKAAN